MPGLLKALFDSRPKPKPDSEEPSLASLPSLAHSEQAGKATIPEGEISDSLETSRAPESQGLERRFGQQHAKLFALLGRKVRTPEGPGTLIQVFAERVTVLLDSERDKCSFFSPTQIEPASME